MTLTDAQVKGLADILAGIYRTELKAGENYKNKTMGDRKIATEVINQCYKQIDTMFDVLEVLGLEVERFDLVDDTITIREKKYD